MFLLFIVDTRPWWHAHEHFRHHRCLVVLTASSTWSQRSLIVFANEQNTTHVSVSSLLFISLWNFTQQMHKSAGTCDWFMPAPINQSIICGLFSHSALFTDPHECLLYFWHHLFSTTSSIFSLIKMACMHISQFFLFLPGLFFLLLWPFPSCGDLRCEQTHAHPETNTVSLCVWPPCRVHHWIAWARVTISASARACVE